jgi:hypothetical protein
MKTSNSNEVSTIFHPRKGRSSVLSHCDEQRNNEFDTTQKILDKTGILFMKNRFLYEKAYITKY